MISKANNDSMQAWRMNSVIYEITAGTSVSG